MGAGRTEWVLARECGVSSIATDDPPEQIILSDGAGNVLVGIVGTVTELEDFQVRLDHAIARAAHARSVVA